MPRMRSSRILWLVVVVGCHHPRTVPDVDGPPCEEPPLVDVTFTEDPADVLGPERGFYAGIDLLAGDSYDSVRANGMTLALALVHLDAYRASALDPALLDQLTAGFARVRAAGIKVILRFNYNDGPVGAADASLAQITGHIAQLQPILAANADVIAFMQAGFIGAWGEWHDSTNGLDTDANHLAVITALLEALPAKRMVQVRTPELVDAMFPGGPIADGDAFSGQPRARIGHHNDCFLASDTDFGTYVDPIEQWKDYIASDARFTPMGGETCNVDSPRSDCPSATAEMARLHTTFVNSEYQADVLASWTTQGCMADVHGKLGYRLVLESARHSEATKPGGRLRLELALRNDGYASPLNPRPLRVVLDAPGTQRVATLTADVRRWLPGPQQIAVTLRVPSDLAPGSYRLSVWAPDPDLEDRPDYALRFANTGVFDAASGLQVIVPALVVDPQTRGEAVGDAPDFVELP
jgi:hypothetical protein